MQSYRTNRSSLGEVGGYQPPDKPTNSALTGPSVVTLDANQLRAFRLAHEGKSLFITGPGGTGKSEVLRTIIEALRKDCRNVAVTASTGIAALHIRGSTIHSFLGTGLASSVETLEQAYTLGKVFITGKRFATLQDTEVLIIDEISMLSGEYLTMADRHLRDLLEVDKPFAGKQVIMCGDFLQLPPVLPRRKRVKERFAFQSPVWKQAGITRCSLSHNHRQTDDHKFARYLNQIRFGDLTRAGKTFLNERVRARLDIDDPLKLYPTNAKVDELNLSKLNELSGPVTVYRGKLTGDDRYHIELVKRCIVPFALKLKRGAKVLLCRNDYAHGFRNGQRGVFERETTIPGRGPYDPPSVHVLEITLDNGSMVHAPRHSWDHCDAKGRVLASLEQYPVKLGWAVTIHKSQGMTLDNVYCDLSRVFEAGQTYVALSRIRRSQGLSLSRPMTKRQVFANRECVEFYPRIGRVGR